MSISPKFSCNFYAVFQHAIYLQLESRVHNCVLIIAKGKRSSKTSIVLNVSKIKDSFGSGIIGVELVRRHVKVIDDTIIAHSLYNRIKLIRKYTISNQHTINYWLNLPMQNSLNKVETVSRCIGLRNRKCVRNNTKTV